LPERRPIRSFVLRQGRISSAQRRAHADLFPAYGVAFSPKPVDLDRMFGRSAPKILEIGFGMGETTADIAREHPENDYLGIEVHTPGVGGLLKRIAELNLKNVRIIQHDAVEVLRHMIPPERLDGVHLFFPDPWPKKRHHKRRLVQAPFLALLSSRMKPGAYVHAATDWEDYARQMLLSKIPPRISRTSAPDLEPSSRAEASNSGIAFGTWSSGSAQPADRPSGQEKLQEIVQETLAERAGTDALVVALDQPARLGLP
jgi:tRNA (guanine-N7-)-methyltransferase